MAGGCLGWLFRLLVEAVAIRVVQEVAKRLTGDRLRSLLAAMLDRIGLPGQDARLMFRPGTDAAGRWWSASGKIRRE